MNKLKNNTSSPIIDTIIELHKLGYVSTEIWAVDDIYSVELELDQTIDNVRETASIRLEYNCNGASVTVACQWGAEIAQCQLEAQSIHHAVVNTILEEKRISFEELLDTF